MVRIYKVNRISKKSKEWCKVHPGEYPPALNRTLSEKKAFTQIHGLSNEDVASPFSTIAPVAEEKIKDVLWQVWQGSAALRGSYLGRKFASHFELYFAETDDAAETQ